MVSLRSAVKRGLFLLPPAIGLAIAESLRWLASRQFRERHRRTMAMLKTIGDPQEVCSGPFAGMRYPLRVGAQGGLLPKLLGTYEAELSEALRVLIATQPSLVVDVGAAEGYYAVGLARTLPDTRVEAFELEPPYHSAIRTLARANGVASRVTVRGACTPETLARSLRGNGQRTAIICDCEGYEIDLLDPAVTPALKHAVILCEVHDRLRPGASEVLRRRFENTHELSVIPTRSRRSSDLPPGIRLSEADSAFAMDEGRGGDMEWFLLCPR